MKDYYYLHLSKTAGRFFYSYVLKEILEYSDSSSKHIKYLFPKTPEPNWTHHGWHDLISDNTYLISSLRDPVEVAVSYAMHHHKVTSKTNLFEAINKFNNLQSKGFIKWNNNMVDPGAIINFDKELILSRLHRVNLLIDSKDIGISTYNIIKEKIAKDLSITNIQLYEKQDDDTFKTPGVKELCNSLTKKEIYIIKEVNYMDVELYEAAKSLFFPI